MIAALPRHPVLMDCVSSGQETKQQSRAKAIVGRALPGRDPNGVLVGFGVKISDSRRSWISLLTRRPLLLTIANCYGADVFVGDGVRHIRSPSVFHAWYAVHCGRGPLWEKTPAYRWVGGQTICPVI